MIDQTFELLCYTSVRHLKTYPKMKIFLQCDGNEKCVNRQKRKKALWRAVHNHSFPSASSWPKEEVMERD